MQFAITVRVELVATALLVYTPPFQFRRKKYVHHYNRLRSAD